MDAGIAALSGPLHGGANEKALLMLKEIGGPEKVTAWYKRARKQNRKIMGIGHRVHKVYDPRAKVLGPLAEFLARDNKQSRKLFDTARALEQQVYVGPFNKSVSRHKRQGLSKAL